MQTSPLAWLTSSPSGKAGAAPSTAADDRFAQLLQNHREQGANRSEGPSRPDSRREPASLARQDSDRAERSSSSMDRSDRNSRTEDSRGENASRRPHEGAERSDSVAERGNADRATSAADAAKAGHPDQSRATASSAQGDDYAAAQAGAKAAAEAPAATVNPLVAQIQELTERSRLLADTVVALKTDPASLTGAQAETISRALDGELAAIDPARLAQEVLPAALEELQALSADALAQLPTTLADSGAAPAGAGDLAALAASAWQALGGATAEAPRPGTGWQPPAPALTAGLPLPGTLAAQVALDSAQPGTQTPTPLTAAVGTLIDDVTARPLVAPPDATAEAARQANRQSADDMVLPVGLAAAPATGAGTVNAPRVAQVNAPLGSPQWGQQFGQQMVRLSSDGTQGLRHAELRLDPPDLGPVRITLSLAGEQASAAFLSPHAAVRQAIEQALPQLQQALADAGIQLGQTSVGEQQTPGDEGSGTGARQFAEGNGDAGALDDASAPVTRPGNAPRGLVDTFA